MTKKELLQGILEDVLYDKDLVSLILQNNTIQHMNYTFPSFSMEQKFNSSGNKIMAYSIVDNHGVTLKEGSATIFGQGSYGQVYYDNVQNVLYKVVSYKIKFGQKPESIRQPFINIIYEVVIQTILSKLTYVTHDNKTTFMAPALYGFYKYDSGRKNELSYVIAMEKAGVVASDSSVLNNFRHVLQDYAILLDTLLNTYNIRYNHCDVKLNNLIYDKNQSLQLIDFGFSSLKVVFDDKSVLQIENPNCGWHVGDKYGVMINMGQNKNNPGYYIQKDLIQLLLTTKSHYYKYMNHETKMFVDNMLSYLGLLRGNKIANTYNLSDPGFGQQLFDGAYNFEGKLRTRFQKQPMMLEKSMPSDLGKQLQNMGFPQKVMPSAPPTSVLYNAIPESFGNTFGAQTQKMNSGDDSNASSFGNSFSAPPFPKELLPKTNDPSEIYRKIRNAIVNDDVDSFKNLMEKSFDVNYIPIPTGQYLVTSGLINMLTSSYPYTKILVEKGGDIYRPFYDFFANTYDAERIKKVIQTIIAQKIPIDFYTPMVKHGFSIYETIKDRSIYGTENQAVIYKKIMSIIKAAQPKPGVWGKIKWMIGRGGRSTRRGRGGYRATRRGSRK